MKLVFPMDLFVVEKEMVHVTINRSTHNGSFKSHSFNEVDNCLTVNKKNNKANSYLLCYYWLTEA